MQSTLTVRFKAEEAETKDSLSKRTDPELTTKHSDSLLEEELRIDCKFV